MSTVSPIDQYHSYTGRYPGNNKQWWVAKADADDPTDSTIKAGDFLPKILDKLYSGNARAPRGHYVLNAFKKDRSAVSGIPDLPVEEIGVRPNAISFFSGRAWYAAQSTIYYSQIIDFKSKAGLCYQEADPTAEDISDLIDSDGGSIPIPEANTIVKITPLANGLMIFAMNGVWFISGGNQGFSATNFSVEKVSSIGTQSPLAIVTVDQTIFWWSEIGIQALQQQEGQFGPIPGKFGNTNISEQTIQSFYNEIPDQSKTKAKAIYDPKNNVIQWLYSDDETDNYRYNRILLFDVTLQAFYPWEVSNPTGTTIPRIAGAFLDTGILEQQFQENVTSSAGNVTTISLDNVTTTVYNTTVENRPTNLTYSTAVGTDLTFSKLTDRTYVDWKSFDTTGVSYSSYLETGFELMDDAMRKKQAVYIFVHLRRTEDDPLSPPTSCIFTTKWDWAQTAFSNKWSRPIEAYRPRESRIPTTADLTTGFPVVVSKNKVRGSGKSVQFRFECSEPGKDFDLLGWAVAYVGNTEP